MISISATEQNSVYGNLLFKELPSSKLNEKTTRLSRVATLDGGVYMQFGGFAEGDRTLLIRALLTSAQREVLRLMFNNYTSTFIAFNDGLFIGAISSIKIDVKEVNITYYIDDRETN